MPRKARVEFPGTVYHLIRRDSKTDPFSSSNALNQYQTFNGVTYNYDYNFNLREAPNWWGVFDAESRLTMAGGGGSVASFTYDGLGHCVRRIVYPPGAPSNTVIYAYDGWKPVLEFDAAGNYRASNIYGVGADEILFRWDTAFGGSIYKQDRHGNIVAVLDQWGNIAERYSYDAFGKAKIMSWWDNNERTSSWIGNRFMFQGREWLGEFGIYDYRHRMYNPGLGRFLQTDPMGLQTAGEKLSAGQKALFSPGGSAPEAFSSSEMNLFRYCGDDPVDRSDSLGLDSYQQNRELGGDDPKSNYNIATHSFTFTTYPETPGVLPLVLHTYSWGNVANQRGWNKDQGEDLRAAQKALDQGRGLNKVGDAKLDGYVEKAYNLLNTRENEHQNLFLARNCKWGAKDLLQKARELQKADEKAAEKRNQK
jgi:RHS repeat-associated protein